MTPVRARFALFFCSLLAGACVRPYRPPAAGEPHALVKFRRVYQASAGATLSERLLIEEEQLFHTSAPASAASAPRSDAFRVHPAPAIFEARSVFSHSELRTVQENYTVQEPYTTTESYNCGTAGQYRTCTRTVTRHRSRTKQRWVTKNVEVVDGACEALRGLSPAVGGVYLLELSYQGTGACQLHCYEQVALPDGQFQNRPCPVPAAAP